MRLTSQGRARSFPLALTFALAFASAAHAAPLPGGYAGHGASSVSPEVLARFAPKPPPAEVARSIQAMLDVRAPGGGLLAPDGKALYFGWSITGIGQIWKADGPRRFPLQLTGGEDETRLADVTPDGKHLVVQRDRKGQENPGLYLQDPNGGPLEIIQHRPGVQTTYQFTSADSRYVYYTANDLKPDSYAIYRYEIASKAIERVFDQPGIWSIADHRPDGALLLAKATGSLTSEIYELSHGVLTPRLGQGELEEYAVRYGAHPGELLVVTNKLSDFRRLYRFVRGQLVPISPDVKHDVLPEFTTDDRQRHIYYATNEDGYEKAHVLDAASYAPLPLPITADYVDARPATHDGRRAIITTSDARHPPRSYAYDWQTRKLVEWVLPSTPEIDTERFAVPALEHYPARDGTPIPMLVRRPERCRDEVCPVVVAFHGGPESQARPLFSPTAQMFVDRGFVYVEPNVRGSDGYGKAWLHDDDGPKRLAVITDIEDAARYIRGAWAKNGVAPKIGVFGGSYGGYSTLVAMTEFAGAYDAGVEIVGMSNLVTFLENTAPYRRMLRISEYGDPVKDHDALVKLSPITYLDRIRAPLLLIQGASDPRVPVGEAVQMYQAMTARRLPAQLIIFPDEGHGAHKRDNRVVQYGEALAFFERHLK